MTDNPQRSWEHCLGCYNRAVIQEVCDCKCHTPQERSMMTKFIMDYDNVPGKGPLMLFKDNGDGTRSLATVEDIAGLEATIASLQDDRTDQEQTIAQKDEEICRLKEQSSESLLKQFSHKSQQFIEAMQEISQLKSKIVGVDEEITSLRVKLEEAEARLVNVETNFEEWKKDYSVLRQKLALSDKKLEEARAALKRLADLDYVDYDHATQIASAALDKLKGSELTKGDKHE